jgi:hypothetical protein
MLKKCALFLLLANTTTTYGSIKLEDNPCVMVMQLDNLTAEAYASIFGGAAPSTEQEATRGKKTNRAKIIFLGIAQACLHAAQALFGNSSEEARKQHISNGLHTIFNTAAALAEDHNNRHSREPIALSPESITAVTTLAMLLDNENIAQPDGDGSWAMLKRCPTSEGKELFLKAMLANPETSGQIVNDTIAASNIYIQTYHQVFREIIEKEVAKVVSTWAKQPHTINPATDFKKGLMVHSYTTDSEKTREFLQHVTMVVTDRLLQHCNTITISSQNDAPEQTT